jgi:hypothetical protein
MALQFSSKFSGLRENGMDPYKTKEAEEVIQCILQTFLHPISHLNLLLLTYADATRHGIA